MDEQRDVAAVIAAEVEENAELSHGARLDEMERRLVALETAVGEARTVTAQAAHGGRKTAVAPNVSAFAKGESGADRAVALDATLSSLSVEQRIAVKTGLMRAGLL